MGIGNARSGARLAAGALAVVLASCSPAPPQPPEARPLSSAANQALVASHAHLVGELPRYGNVSWQRRADIGDAAVFDLKPNGDWPSVTARVSGDRIVALSQHGSLSRRSLAALAAGAGAAPGEHGPTAEKIEALLAQAKASGRTESATIGGVSYAASPGGDSVTATP